MPRVFHTVAELRACEGQEVSTGEWFEVAQARIDAFAEATEDRQWIHVDPARAKAESPYGSAIAHGFLTLSLISHLVKQAVTLDVPFQRGINYGLNRVRFPAAVPAGSRIRARVTLVSLADVADGIQITWAVTVEVEGGAKPALAAEWLVRYYA